MNEFIVHPSCIGYFLGFVFTLYIFSLFIGKGLSYFISALRKIISK